MKFAQHFDNEMKKSLEESVPELKWKRGWRPKGVGQVEVDLAGLDEGGHACVIIEAELKKDDPAANVIKIWRWAVGQKNTKPILFVQGFSGLYTPNKTRTRLRERAEFVGDRMTEAGFQIDYKSKYIKYRGRTGKRVLYTPKTGRGFRAKLGGGALASAAQGFAKTVAKVFHSTSPSTEL